MIKKLMQSNSFFSLVFIICLVILGNYFAAMVPWKIDVSPGHVYSLSTSSKKILAGLKKPVVITLYISSSLPANVSPVKTDVMDLLDEYKRFGNIQVKLISPDGNSKIENEAVSEGVVKLQFSQVQNDQVSVKNGFFGAVIAYDQKKETLPSLLNAANLEYNLTSAIYRLTRTNMQRVGVVAQSKYQLLTNLNSVMKQQFDFQLVNFQNLNSFDAEAVIIKDDRLTRISTDDIKLLDDFVNRGKLVVVFADGIWINEQIQTLAADHGLSSWLGKYGLRLNKDLILSPYAETASFKIGAVNFISKYPFWIRLSKQDFDKELTFVDDGMSPLIPWVSSIAITPKKGIVVKPLMYAPVPSVLQQAPFQLLPDKVMATYPKDQKNKYVIGAQVKKGKATIILISSSRFIEDSFAVNGSPNLMFVSKLFDTYLSQGTLSGIRSRDIQYSPIAQVDETTKQTIRWFDILVPSVILILYGFWRFMVRRRMGK